MVVLRALCGGTRQRVTHVGAEHGRQGWQGTTADMALVAGSVAHGTGTTAPTGRVSTAARVGAQRLSERAGRSRERAEKTITP